jgi:thiol-disulfide isomerase/thioredoxin
MRSSILVCAVFSLIIQQSCDRKKSEREVVHGELTTAGGPVFFELLVDTTDKTAPALLPNGSDTLTFNRVSYRNDSVLFHFDALDSYIITGKNLERGIWQKRASKGSRKSMPFTRKATAPFPQTSIDNRFDGEWNVIFYEKDGAESPATGVFSFDQGFLKGTFLTETGDYRFLTGKTTPDGFTLWTFDIAHAYAFTAKLRPDATLEGQFYPYNDAPVRWTAQRGASTLRDPMTVTRLVPGARIQFSFPDVNGTVVSHTDKAFSGKPLLVYLFGSWCPNCADESKLIKEISEAYRASDLAIVGLAFEYTGDPKEDLEMVKRYRSRFNVTWTTLLAGSSDKADASAKIPFVEKVVSFPTSFFVRRDGSIAAVHTGFSGPGTGAAYNLERQRFKAHLEEIIRP